MSAEVEGDAKAGFCSNCRRGDHTLCASPTCTCPDMRRHRNRPSFGHVNVSSAPLRPVERNAPPPAVSGGLVWCDPPSRTGGSRYDYVTLCAPCKAKRGVWARVRLYKSKSAASPAAKVARKQLGDGWEVKSARIDGGSGLWVRFTGESS